MKQELSEIVEEIIENYSTAYTCLLGNGWRTMVPHDYSPKVSGFSDGIGQLELPIVDSATTVRTENNDEIIIRINQGSYKPD